jgi:hypothetical protein
MIKTSEMHIPIYQIGICIPDKGIGFYLIYGRLLPFKDGKVITKAPMWTPQAVEISSELHKYFND